MLSAIESAEALPAGGSGPLAAIAAGRVEVSDDGRALSAVQPVSAPLPNKVYLPNVLKNASSTSCP